MTKKLIAHRIDKEEGSIGEVFLRPELISKKNQQAEPFVESIQKSFRDRSTSAAHFAVLEGVEPAFQQLLGKYRKNVTDKSFIEFSRNATNYLFKEMGRQRLATGGYIVFVEFERDGSDYLLVTLLGVSPEPAFNKEMDLIASEMPDVRRFRHAVRVSYSLLDSGSEVPLVFLSKGSDTSRYFQQFVGCEEVEKPKNIATSLTTQINGWFEDQGEGASEVTRAFSRVAEYNDECRKTNISMTLEGIAERLSPDRKNEMLSYLGDEKSGLPGEFNTLSPDLIRKNFRNFVFEAPGIRVSLDRSKWTGNVRVQDGSVVIDNAPEDLIKRVKAEMSDE